MASKALIAPVLSYLFHRLEERFDGRPTLLILDEAWLFLDHPLFASQIRAWLKTLRKKNVAVVFATQSLADIETSAIAPAIVESCLTRIFLPNARAAEPQSAAVYRRFGLNDRQISIIARATPKRDYYLQSAAGNRLFELGLGPVALSLCAAASPSDQKLINKILATVQPERFAHAFLAAKDLGWAAQLLDEVVAHEPDPGSGGPVPNSLPAPDEDAKAMTPDPALLAELAERLSPYRA